MKIYNKNTGAVLYDNQPGASDAELPLQAVGANSAVVINGTNSNLITTNASERPELDGSTREVSNDLAVVAYPNPSPGHFSINVNGRPEQKISMQVVDVYGRVVEARQVNANSTTRFGHRYKAGIYFVRVMQGKLHKEIKLVKSSN